MGREKEKTEEGKKNMDATLHLEVFHAIRVREFDRIVPCLTEELDVNGLNENKDPLIWSVTQVALFDVAKFLCSRQVNLNTQDDKHCSPLELACEMGLREFAELFVSQGASFAHEHFQFAFTGQNHFIHTTDFADILYDSNKNTILHYAVGGGNIDLVRFLCANHPLFLSLCNRNGLSPFLQAAKNG